MYDHHLPGKLIQSLRVVYLAGRRHLWASIDGVKAWAI